MLSRKYLSKYGTENTVNKFHSKFQCEYWEDDSEMSSTYKDVEFLE
jgi:hypothetical protein